MNGVELGGLAACSVLVVGGVATLIVNLPATVHVTKEVIWLAWQAARSAR